MVSAISADHLYVRAPSEAWCFLSGASPDVSKLITIQKLPSVALMSSKSLEEWLTLEGITLESV